jgi:LPXTG-motif cell wall-anchored protein
MRRLLLVLGLLVAGVVTTASSATETTTPTGSIDVDKEVDGDPPCKDDDPCFVVEIVCEDQVTRRQVYDGTGHLIEGPSTFHRIPSGDVCVVTETETGGATVTYDPGQTVVITPEDPDSDEDQRVHVLVTNTFCEKDEDDCQPPPTTTVPTTTSTTTTSTTTSTTAPPPPPTSSIPPPTTIPPPPTTDPPTTTVPPPPTTDPCEPPVPNGDNCDPTTTTSEPPLSSIVTVPPTDPPPTTDPCADNPPPEGCELPRTGSDHLRPWAAAGLILLTAGAALVIVTRKRVTG